LREIYLTGMEIAVKKSHPWTVMGAYNRLNGTFCCENKTILTEILRGEWGFKGVVVTDWGACNDRVLGMHSGLDLEMPSSRGINDKKLISAVKKGRLSTKTLDESVERLVDLIMRAKDKKLFNYKYDMDMHHQIARKAASQSIVLLKNANAILPLDDKCKIAVIGEFAKVPRYQGAGSSLINPIRLENVHDEMMNRMIDFSYAKGYDINDETLNIDLIDEACDIANSADVVIIMAGLPENYESEGYDRPHMRLPDSHNYLIKRIIDINRNVIVVLSGGSPMEMPWIDDIQGLIHTYLGGQSGASALLDVLFGNVNPSGKLTESYPLRLEDNPSDAYFSLSKQKAEYRESIYVGYRYYITAKKNILFPFGFGLSYTEFEYKDLAILKTKFKENETIDVKLTIKNNGDRSGAEIVQLYVRDILSTPFRPDRELKGFTKVFLNPGEEKELIFKLNQRSFAYFNTVINDWHVEEGEFEILIGASSIDIRLNETVYVESIRKDIDIPDYRKSLPVYHEIHKKNFCVEEHEFATLYGRNLPEYPPKGAKPYSLNSTLEDIQDTLVGKLIGFMLKRGLKKHLGISDEFDPSYRMMWYFVYESPLRIIAMMGGHVISLETIEGVLKISNGKFFAGLMEILKSLYKTER
ncbi:MAG: glycoside hydrolase family 3 C-terminal domain-containing protein, partial [Dethiosulfatibacter sp.]|nr:glycoside hydrolase family 3 C-terminal domain-containing protein [Dethiosulfatibacter sp.]